MEHDERVAVSINGETGSMRAGIKNKGVSNSILPLVR